MHKGHFYLVDKECRILIYGGDKRDIKISEQKNSGAK